MSFTNNYSIICRTCTLKTTEMKPIFDSEEFLNQKDSLSTILMSFTSLRLFKGDGLPEQICMECFQQLSRLVSFRKLCESSDIHLKGTDRMFAKQLHVTRYEEGSATCNLISQQQMHSNEGCFPKENKQKKVYPCEKCKMECLGLGEYRRHIMEVHHLKCDICGHGFRTKILLSQHVLKHNHPDRQKKIKCRKRRILPRTCEICNKTFQFHSNLERHRLIHTGERPYLCNVCGKGFAQLSYLKIHVHIHTGEKPYKCTVCERRFAAPGTLMTHLRTHTGERPHVCKICGKDFPQAGYLASHIRIHTGEKPSQCNVCSRKFNQSGRLNIHMRIHSGEKPYNCEECGRSFAVRGTLKKHIRTHTGERPYSCSVCGLTFAQSGTLSTHMKVHSRS